MTKNTNNSFFLYKDNSSKIFFSVLRYGLLDTLWKYNNQSELVRVVGKRI